MSTSSDYLHAEDLFVELRKSGKMRGVKRVSKVCPFDKGIQIIDISLSGKGMNEDKMYAFDQNFRRKIRRGNTLLDIDGDIFWGRKGFRKFFDIHKEYIDYNLGEKNALSKIKFRTYKEHVNLKDIIFKDASKLIKEGEEI